MSILTEDRYIFPRKPGPVLLDVTKLEGTLGGPAQYFGETPDGRDVYCRLRNGALSVRVSRSPGGDALDADDYLFHENIGLGSLITKTQLCNLAGITINGEMPEFDMEASESDIEYYGLPRDLSGATTFYRNEIDCTAASQEAFVEKLLATFDPISCVHLSSTAKSTGSRTYERIWHGYKIFDPLRSFSERRGWSIFLDQIPDASMLSRGDENTISFERLFPDNLVIGVSSGIRQNYGTDESYERQIELLTNNLGVEVETLYRSKNLETGRFCFECDFLKVRKDYTRLLEKFDSLFDDFFRNIKLKAQIYCLAKQCPK